MINSQVLTLCCGGPINGESFHLMSLESKHWGRWFLISDICGHNIWIIHCIQWAGQVPDVYFAFLWPCGCHMLLTNSCCLIKRNFRIKIRIFRGKKTPTTIYQKMTQKCLNSCILKKNFYKIGVLPWFYWHSLHAWQEQSLALVCCLHPHHFLNHFLLHLHLI